ncbi:MAG: hypothetical protein OIN66_13465 [Candidatus Methanoperedens sp.]|nr:hypothetical protein [Candidatus Methanoperedens sp.]
MWIYPKKRIGAAEMKSIIRKLEADLRRKVKLLVLTDKIIKSLKEEYPEFYLKLKLTSVGGDIFD